jgi:tetratricopeptide (TPR) repeat protein
MRAPDGDKAAVRPVDRRRWWHTPWLPVLLGVLCYLNSLTGDFVYDDYPLVQENPRIRTLTDPRAIWLTDWWRPANEDEGGNPRRDRLYRPLTLFTFALNYAAGGLKPVGYHATNIALHAAVCGLVWAATRRLLGDPSVATVAGVLFAVHPVHAEAVANIVGRAEVLAAGFLLLGILALRPPTDVPGDRRIILAALAFLAALFAKETAICYSLVAVLVLAKFVSSWSLRRRVLYAVWLLAPLLIYLPLRYVALEGKLFRAQPADDLMNPLVTARLGERLLAALTILGHYTRLLLVPQRLSCDYGLAVVDPSRGVTGMTLLGLLTAVGGLPGLVAGLFRSAWRPVTLLCGMLVASYVLISNTVLLIGVSLAERLFYWPSVPGLMLVALGLVSFWRRWCAAGGLLAPRRRLLGVLAGLLLAALGLRTVVRNMDWADNLTLFQQDVATYPQSAHLNACYASALLQVTRQTPDAAERERLLLRARRHLDAAVAIAPSFVQALTAGGQVRAQLGDLDGARTWLERALWLRPGDRTARAVLARLQQRDPNTAGRLEVLQAAVEQRPDDVESLLALGNALMEAGRFLEARRPLERAATLAPADARVLRQFAKALLFPELDERAVTFFQRAAALDPDDWETHVNLTVLLAKTDPAGALAHAQRAMQLQPDDERVQINLAEALALSGQVDEALERLRRIESRLSPDDPRRAILRARVARLEQDRR